MAEEQQRSAEQQSETYHAVQTVESAEHPVRVPFFRAVVVQDDLISHGQGLIRVQSVIIGRLRAEHFLALEFACQDARLEVQAVVLVLDVFGQRVTAAFRIFDARDLRFFRVRVFRVQDIQILRNDLVGGDDQDERDQHCADPNDKIAEFRRCSVFLLKFSHSDVPVRNSRTRKQVLRLFGRRGLSG